MRRFNKLSAQFVRQKFIKPGKYGDGQNLYLVVSSETARSWVFRYTLKGVEAEKGLGSAWDVDLAEARLKAAELRRLLASGVDPTEHLNPKKIPTFEEVLAEYVSVFASRWTNAKSPHQWLKTADYVPVLAKMPVDQIKTADVKAALLPIWTRIKEVASRTRGRIESVLDYAKHQEYRDGDNPARWKGCLEYVLPRQTIDEQHHRALPYEDVPSFYNALSARSADASAAYRFCILTATRTDEVRMARWEEIDLVSKTWNIPKDRMKARRPFCVPLTTAALEILEKIGPKAEGYIFEREPGKPFSNNALLALRNRMGFKGKCTTHGFRSSFRIWAHHKRLDWVACEMCLDHKVLDKTQGAYMRDELLEQRREILTRWAEHVTQQPTTSIVINLPRSNSNGAI